MGAFFIQSLTLLTASPANLVYHLVLAFSIVAALRPSLDSWRMSRHPLARRKVVGISLLLIAQIILFIVGALAQQGIIDAHLSLPPLDRAVVAFSLLWIVWLWAFQDRLPVVEAAVAILTLLIVIFLAINYISWSSTGSPQAFNLTWFNFVWEIISIYILINGCLGLIVRKPPQWTTGLAMFILILAGYVAQLMVLLPDSDFLGAVRLAMVAAFPLLIALPHSHSDPFESYQASLLDTPHPVTGEKRRFSVDLSTWQALLDLSLETSTDQFCGAASRAVGKALLADVCYFVSYPPAKNQVILECGYNLVHDENVPGAVIENNRVPKLSKALKESHVLVVNKDFLSTRDAKSIQEATKMDNPGNLLFIPFVSGGKIALGGLLLLTPYSSRRWTKEDVAYLKPASNVLVQMMHHVQESAHYQNGYDTTQADLQTALTELEQTRAEHQDLVRRFIALRAQPSQSGEQQSQPGLTSIAASEDAAGANLSQFQQSVSTILGYAELLLGETLGGLAIPHRKLVEQIRDVALQANQQSVTLMGNRPEQMIQVTQPAQSVDLKSVIDQAIQETSTQKLMLTFELPDQIPLVRSDREAILCTLKSILEEAALANGSAVNMLLSVTVLDGIDAPEKVKLTIQEEQSIFSGSDLPAVFVPTAENSEGVDVELVAAKSRIETHGGEVSVELDDEDMVTITIQFEVVRG